VTRARGDTDVDRCVAEIAATMTGRLPEIVATIQQALEEDIPDLRGDALTIDLLGASVEGNVNTMLRALRYDISVERVEAPTAALEYARRLAQHGVPVNALVRAYRLGQRLLNDLVFAQVRSTDIEPQAMLDVIEAISAKLFEYIDWISQQVVVVYENERERWLENRNSVRAVRVREVLAGKKSIDVDAASTSIRYPLRWHHVALVISYPDTESEGDELSRLQRFMRELAEAAHAGATPLFVAADRISAWAWLPYRAAAGDVGAGVRRFVSTRADTPSVGIGSPAAGVEGFRRSHHQALGAHAVAIAGGLQRTVIAATDPGLSIAAMLGGDLGEVRCWVSDVLGDLATDSESDARLRETLRVFLRCGSSYKMAANELNLHFNSVKYRVGRAAARRGRAIEGDCLDVEVALLVCHWYGAGVLREAPAIAERRDPS
jgi:DNA-binding PucR family transcriptional regulator